MNFELCFEVLSTANEAFVFVKKILSLDLSEICSFGIG